MKEVQVESKVLGVDVGVALCYYGSSGASVDCGVSWFLRMTLESKRGEEEQLKGETVQMEM